MPKVAAAVSRLHLEFETRCAVGDGSAGKAAASFPKHLRRTTSRRMSRRMSRDKTSMKKLA
jgi:hypothetical protein